MKMRKLHKIGIAVLFGVMLICAGACGDGEATEKKESGLVQTIQEKIPEESQEETQEKTPEESQEEIPEKSPEAQQADSSGEAGEAAATGVQAPEETEGAGKTEKEEVPQAGNQEGTQKLFGGILSLEEGSFVIEQYVTREYADGGSVAINDAEKEGAHVTVRYTQDTVFTLITVPSDGSRNYIREEGSKANLEIGKSVSLTGTWEGQEFLADTASLTLLE